MNDQGTAGQRDYAARMLQIEKQREDYYRKLGTPPGVPTMKGATADPDNTGYGYNTIIGELGDHSVPEGWVQRPKFNDKGDVPGPPIQWDKPEDPDNAQPGYGFVPTDTTNTEESSSIIATTSAAPLTSPTPRPTSPNSMRTCRMASCSLMNTAVVRRCRINSTERSLIKKQGCTTMERGI